MSVPPDVVDLAPAPEPERELLHHRRVDMRGYRRSDGLFEVEGHLTDRKPFDFTPASGDHTVSAGEPVHDMGVRLVFDASMVVREVHTFTHAAPYAICPAGGLAVQAMKGVRIGAGWSNEVRMRLRGPQCCTHLAELLLPMATTAIQTMSATRNGQPDAVDASGRPRQIDSCYAYAAERELVKRRWPSFHRSAPSSTDEPS